MRQAEDAKLLLQYKKDPSKEYIIYIKIMKNLKIILSL